MRMFSMIIVATFMVAVMLFSTTVQAEEAAAKEEATREKITLNIYTDEQMNKAAAAYKAATENLTEAQKAELAELEKEFARTMDHDMRIFDRASKIDHCAEKDLAFKDKEAGYREGFAAWREQMNADQKQLWAAHRTLRQKIAYVDQAVLDDYYVYQAKMSLQLMGGMDDIAQKHGFYDKTDCAAFAAELDTEAVPQ